MLSLADRMYDAWVTREPDWASWEPPPPPHCTSCGGFLKREPEGQEGWAQEEPCTGQPDPEYGWTPCERDGAHEAHTYVVAAGVTETRTCKKCGMVNSWVEM
jgi:hypothetical protein